MEVKTEYRVVRNPVHESPKWALLKVTYRLVESHVVAEGASQSKLEAVAEFLDTDGVSTT